jgi:hypothetical protein
MTFGAGMPPPVRMPTVNGSMRPRRSRSAMAYLEHRAEGAPIEDHELVESALNARQAAVEAARAEELAESYRRSLPETPAPSEAPRPRMRVMSAAAMLGWRQHVLSMPQEVAAFKKLDPYRPPLLGPEEI